MTQERIRYRVEALKQYIELLQTEELRLKVELERRELAKVQGERNELLKEYIDMLNRDIKGIEGELQYFRGK